MPSSTSPAYTLNATDWSKGLRGAGITLLAGAGITLLMDLIAMLQACVLSLSDPSVVCLITFGPFQYLGQLIYPVLITLAGFLLEMVRRYKTDHTGS